MPATDRDLMRRLAQGEREALSALMERHSKRVYRIARALETLPEAHRAVFVLRHYDGLTLEEIALALGIRLGTVKSSLHRAIHRLRERLHEVAP